MGDIDGDSDLDLVSGNVLTEGGEGGVAALRNDGSGSFGSRVDLKTDGDVLSVQLGDLHGDGDLDLVAGGQDHEHASVFRNEYVGRFGFRRDFQIGRMFSLALADFDSDGALDLATVIDLMSLRVTLNDGDAGFGQPVVDVGSFPLFVSLADLNGDSNLDIITANGTLNDTVSIALSAGVGSFLPRVDVVVGDVPQSVALVDVDGDLDLDLVTANFAGNSVSVLRNNGTGAFSSRVDFAVGAFPQTVLSGDFDGDLDVDLAPVGDIDGDSDSDIAIANDEVVVVRNDGAGHFGSATAQANVFVAQFVKPVTISGKEGDDAKAYQERAVQLAIEESKK